MKYDPLDGDYPIIEIRGCPVPQYPDEMIFWIYNDAGSIHTQTQGHPIQMEVQVQAFAYATNDEVNNMTFQRYKLINQIGRASCRERVSISELRRVVWWRSW